MFYVHLIKGFVRFNFGLIYSITHTINYFSCCRFPWPHVHEGGRRADVERTEQEQLLLCRVDPQQREDRRLRHPSPWLEDGLHLCRQHNRRPGDLQENQRAVHCYVQA